MAKREPLTNMTPCEIVAARAAHDQWFGFTFGCSFLSCIGAAYYFDARFPEALPGPTLEIVGPVVSFAALFLCHFLGHAVGHIASNDLVRKMRR